VPMHGSVMMKGILKRVLQVGSWRVGR